MSASFRRGNGSWRLGRFTLLPGQLEIRLGRLEDLQPETLRDEPGGLPGHEALAYHDDTQTHLGHVLRSGNLKLDLGTGRNHRFGQNKESAGREIHHDSLVTLRALHDLAEETPLDPLQPP